MSDSDFDRPDGAALYGERLLGLRGECPVCSGVEDSTGWPPDVKGAARAGTLTYDARAAGAAGARGRASGCS